MPGEAGKASHYRWKRSVIVSFVVREHYVPKFLLSQFTGCDGNLWVYDKAEVNWFQSTPTNVGIEKNIYDQSVEKWLSAEIEAPVSSIFRDLDNGKKDLSEEELLLISKFIAVQRVRVRAIETYTELNQPGLIHDKLKETFYDLAGKSGVEAGSKLLAQAEQDPSEFLKQNGLHNLCNLALIGTMHDDDFEIAKSMVQMAWRIIRPEDDRYIVTDNPVVIGIPYEVNESRECVLPVLLFSINVTVNCSA